MSNWMLFWPGLLLCFLVISDPYLDTVLILRSRVLKRDPLYRGSIFFAVHGRTARFPGMGIQWLHDVLGVNKEDVPAELASSEKLLATLQMYDHNHPTILRDYVPQTLSSFHNKVQFVCFDLREFCRDPATFLETLGSDSSFRNRYQRLVKGFCSSSSSSSSPLLAGDDDGDNDDTAHEDGISDSVSSHDDIKRQRHSDVEVDLIPWDTELISRTTQQTSTTSPRAPSTIINRGIPPPSSSSPCRTVGVSSSQWTRTTRRGRSAPSSCSIAMSGTV